MSTNLYLNWAIVAISLFNALLLTWLGLTVLLNSDRRAWGIWIASAGLLLGALFFVSHSAIAGLGFNLTWRSMVFWWTMGMFPVILLPFAWYVVILWYAGFWASPPAPLRQRQRLWAGVVITMLLAGLAAAGVGVILLAIPAPELNPLRGFVRWSIAGIPLLAVGYSVYVLLCIGLSLDALRQPGSSDRMMGTLARRRARPYLMAASLVLLAVSLLVTGAILWVVQDARRRTFLDIYFEARETVAWFDLLIAALVCMVILLLGQAVVSYEVFTGKTLPRRGLARHWYRAILLSLVTAVLVSATLTIQLRPLYSQVLVAMLVAVFYALVSWRSYVERERYMEQLRPFVRSQRLLDQLLTQSTPQEVDISLPFRALCANVLEAEMGYLTAVGPLAPLVGPPLVYPSTALSPPPLTNLIAQFRSPHTLMHPLDPAVYGGAIWAIPLWSERGLIGLFLLGEKSGGGLYSQEEIELARVSSERLIDTQASAEMARRLMSLQRERLAQSQVIDQQTRRVLHDDILPGLQAAMIALNSGTPNANGQTAEALNLMSDAHKQISDLLHQMPTTTAPEVARLGLIRALRRSVENDLAHAFDEVVWQIEPIAAEKVETIPTLTAEVVFYAAREVIRNAAKYGRGEDGARPLQLHLSISWPNGLLITIQDNGIGFQPASPSTSSGQGLALHSTMMAVVGGAITIDSLPGNFTRVSLTLPPI
jgi:signal transduction histidine kinase